MVTLVLKDLLLQKKLLGLELAYILVLSYAFRTMGEWLPLSIISTVGFMFVILSGAWDTGPVQIDFGTARRSNGRL